MQRKKLAFHIDFILEIVFSNWMFVRKSPCEFELFLGHWVFNWNSGWAIDFSNLILVGESTFQIEFLLGINCSSTFQIEFLLGINFSNWNSTFQSEKLLLGINWSCCILVGNQLFKVKCCWGLMFHMEFLFGNLLFNSTSMYKCNLSQLIPVQNAGIHVSELLLGSSWSLTCFSQKGYGLLLGST